MIRRVVSGVAVPILGVAIAFCTNQLDTGIVQTIAGHQLGLELAPIALCLNGEIEETGKCDSPFPFPISNYCDFVGCEQVKEDDFDEFQFPYASIHRCSGIAFKFTGEVDQRMNHPFWGDRPGWVTRHDRTCLKAIKCELVGPDPWSNCIANRVSGFNPDFNVPGMMPGFKPLYEGFCNAMGPHELPFDPIPGFCSYCFEKDSYTAAEAEMLSHFDVKAKRFVVSEDCEPNPALGGGGGGGGGAPGAHGGVEF